MKTPPLRALLLSDGKPGHHHQAEGVLAAIARLRTVETIRLDVRRRFVIPTRTLLQFVNLGVSPAAILRIGYRLDPASLPPADLVVSAGGETLAANAASAKLLGVPNIFCGRLRQLAPRHVSLVLVSLESLATHPNHLVCLPPSAFDAGRPAGRAVRLGRGNPPRRVGVLIGGNSGAFRYAGEDWRQLTAFLRDAHRTHGIGWRVTTSRRSDSAIADALTQMAADAGCGVETFVDVRTAGSGTLAEIFAAADAVLCTDDSTTMISEAVGASLPVVAVRPAATRLEAREAEYRQLLARNGWYRALLLSQLTPDAFLGALGEIAPRTTSQLEELAAALSHRLPQLFAPSPPPTTKAVPSS